MGAKTYSKTPVLSKVKIGDKYYYLKDADARAILDTYGSAATYDVDTEVKDESTGIATTAVMKNYVDAQVGSIKHFEVKIYTTLPTASADTMYIIGLVAEEGTVSGSYVEYITVRQGSEEPYTYSWEKIGSTKVDLSDYVQKTTTIAGIDLQDNIATSELQTALNLGSLAYKDEASGTVPTQDITGVTGTYTPAGTITVNALNQTETGATVSFGTLSISGDVSGDAIKGGSISVTLKDAASATEASLTKATFTPAGNVVASATISAVTSVSITADDNGAFQVGGTVSTPTITVSASTASVLGSVKDAGVLPTKATDTYTAASIETGFFSPNTVATWTGATYTAPSLGNATTAKFAESGLAATIGTGDDAECLIFSAASTADAVTAQGAFSAGSVNFGSFNGGSAASIDTTKFNGGSFVEGAFTQGSMPTFNSADVVVGATAAADAPVFTGSKYAINAPTAQAMQTASFTATNSADIVNKVEYLKQEVNAATFTGEAASLSFSKDIANALVTSVKYDKATANGASFNGEEGTVAVGTITVAASSVTVK